MTLRQAAEYERALAAPAALAEDASKQEATVRAITEGRDAPRS